MQKKNWLIGAVAAVAVVVCGAIGIKSISAADADTKFSLKDNLVFEQIGAENYDKRNYNWFSSSDEKKITVIAKDGTIKNIDNTDGKYGNIEIASSAFEAEYNSSFDGILISNSDKKFKYINYDGSDLACDSGFHDKIKIYKFNGVNYYAFSDKEKDNGTSSYSYKTIIKSEDGTDVTSKLFAGESINYIIDWNNISDTYIALWNGPSRGYKYFDKNLNEVDFATKLAQDGYIFSDVWSYGKDYIRASYYLSSETNIDPKLRNYYYKYYDLSLNEYADLPPILYYSPAIDGARPAVTENVAENNFNIFRTYLGGPTSQKYNLEGGFESEYAGVLLGYKVILGKKYGDSSDMHTTRPIEATAVFDENGVKIFDDVVAGYGTDKIITYDISDKKYKIYKVSLKSTIGEDESQTKETTATQPTIEQETTITQSSTEQETTITQQSTEQMTTIVQPEVTTAEQKIVEDVVAGEVDENNLVDENGNKITKDDLDPDAKAVLEQKFVFKLDAGKNVIPEGAKLSVSKVVAGKEYVAAKKATEKVADKIAVFSIDLLNSDNVKVQPNGKLEITTDIPTGYDVNRIAVYRLSEDGTSYTKLDSKVVNGKVVFETDHFSTYMIAEEKSTISDVDTGDRSVSGIIFFVVILTIAGIIATVSFKKSRV